MLFIGSFAHSIFISMRVNIYRLMPTLIVFPFSSNLTHENVALYCSHHHFRECSITHDGILILILTITRLVLQLLIFITRTVVVESLKKIVLNKRSIEE